MMESFESKIKALFHTEVTGFYPTGHGGVGEESEVTIPTYNIGKLVDLAREADAALTAKDAEIARLQPRKIAPVQGYYPGIPWDMHLRAYAAYCKKWSPQKALIEGNCRGGFGTEELDEFIPGWLDELSERTRLTAINTAKGELIEWYSNHVVGAFGSKGIQKHNELRARIRSLEDE